MKNYPIVLFLLLLSNLSLCQNGSKSLEVFSYVRIDNYPEFSYVLNGRPSTDFIEIKGVSIGSDFLYKIPISKNWTIRPGLGYYRYSFNKIERNNTSFGSSNSRNINYTSSLFIPFFTDKYFYNSLSINIGIERKVILKNNYQVNIAADIKNYLNISQNYHLTNNPNGSQIIKNNNVKFLGTSAIISASLVKNFGKIAIGPSLFAPYFDIWKTDAIFPGETGSGTRNKVFGGLGFGVVFNYGITKN